jgi:hypothetical protein
MLEDTVKNICHDLIIYYTIKIEFINFFTHQQKSLESDQIYKQGKGAYSAAVISLAKELSIRIQILMDVLVLPHLSRWGEKKSPPEFP